MRQCLPFAFAFAMAFLVNPPTPTISALSPASFPLGTAVTMTITGTNFAPNAIVVPAGTGIAAGPATVVNSTRITVPLTFTSGPGQRTLQVVIPAPGSP